MQNLILGTDSYKVTHGALYPPGTETIYSYFESRGGKYPETVFFGLQGILQANLAGKVVSPAKIDEAEILFDAHFGRKLFDAAWWRHICVDHGGLLPLSIKAVPEGTVVPISNVLMTVENTCPRCYALTNYVETLLVQTWYPTTVATIARQVKKIILRYLERTGTPELIDFMLHDFGFRGVSSPESAGIGGTAMLAVFKGSDNLAALPYARDYYHSPMAAFSIPATEHSVMTINGPEGELDQIRRLLQIYPTGPVACVVDSYDIWDTLSNKIGTVLHDEILARAGVFLARPDSGYPPQVVVEACARLYAKFGGATNPKGYKLLDPHVRLVQGDGMNPDSVEETLHQMQTHGYSADNIGTFGMGGGLLQQCNRDTQRFKFACSSRTITGVEADVYKQPLLDDQKNSKRGRLALVPGMHGLTTVTEASLVARGGQWPQTNQLVEVFRNGAVIQEWTLDACRARAALTETPVALTV